MFVLASFIGLVRDHNQGRHVSFLDYEAFEPLAVRALGRIVDEIRQAWPDTCVGVHHRTGRIEIGEGSVIIVAVSPQVDVPFLPFVFDISMGVRRTAPELRNTIDGILARRHASIDSILDAFGVPRPQGRTLAATSHSPNGAH